MVLGKKFFERPGSIVARELLGKYLVRCLNGKMNRFMITEVEAYGGFKDSASHASHGLTKRNAPMFGEAGRWYVYFTYGMHHMLNIVTGPKDYPAAVLVRGVEGIDGPGRITKQLRIDKKFNDKIAAPKTNLWIENDPKSKNLKFKIKNLPRIGVAYAGPVWSKKLLRFQLQTSGIDKKA